jgi:hypothetical protein
MRLARGYSRRRVGLESAGDYPRISLKFGNIWMFS